MTQPVLISLQADYRTTLAKAAELGGADLIATSPPYADARTYGADVSWTMADYQALGDACFAALRPGGWLLLNLDAPVRSWRPGMGTERGLHPWRTMLDYADRVGFRVPDRLAFGRPGAPGEYRGRFRNDWEPLLWFQRPGGDAWFDKSCLDRKADNVKVRSYVVRTKDGQLTSRKASGDAHSRGIKRAGTLLNYGAGASQTGAPDIEAEGHPARWPYRLAFDLVRCFCPPGGLVVDPFGGAGTTAAAALVAGRRALTGDLLTRQTDGKPWAEIAADIACRRLPESGVVEVDGGWESFATGFGFPLFGGAP